MDRKRFTIGLILAAIIFGGTHRAGPAQRSDSPIEFVVDRFSSETTSDGFPKGWESLTFKKIPRHTAYSIEQTDANYYLKAESHASASGLIKRLELKPHSYPILSWRWKVEGIIRKGDERRKDGDDYAARVYVTFKYDPKTAGVWEKIRYGTYKTLYGEYPPKASLNYIWANKLPKGEWAVSSYTDRSRMIAVESGDAGLREWHAEQRDIVEDYRELFGEDPPMIQGIAIMTDTDNTGESAVAYYDDIVFRKDRPP